MGVVNGTGRTREATQAADALRLAGITTLEAANQWIAQTYTATHNAAFAVTPEQEGTALCPTAPAWPPTSYASRKSAKACPGDMTSPTFPQTLVDATVSAFGGLDIIVNNAGYTWDNVIQKTTDEQFQAMLDIHVTAPFRMLRAASGFLRESAKREIAEGRRVMRKVVNITSIAATDGGAGQSGYGSGKAAVIF